MDDGLFDPQMEKEEKAQEDPGDVFAEHLESDPFSLEQPSANDGLFATEAQNNNPHEEEDLFAGTQDEDELFAPPPAGDRDLFDIPPETREEMRREETARAEINSPFLLPCAPIHANDSEEAAWERAETSQLCRKEIISNALRLTLNENLANLVKSPTYVARMEKMLSHTKELEKKLLDNIETTSKSSQSGEMPSSMGFAALLSGLESPPEEMSSLHMNKLFHVGLEAMQRTCDLNEVHFSELEIRRVETIGFFEISDHLRECIPGVLDTGLRKLSDPAWKSLADQKTTQPVEQPCAGKQNCWAYVHFKLVLRRCKGQYCELCHWYLVNYRRLISALSTAPIRHVCQQHRFTVDTAPTLHNGELVPSFSADIMDPSNSDIGFDGVFDFFPRIGKDMFCRTTVQKEVINPATNERRTFRVAGLTMASWTFSKKHPAWQQQNVQLNDASLYSRLESFARSIAGGDLGIFKVLEYYVLRHDAPTDVDFELRGACSFLTSHAMQLPLDLAKLTTSVLETISETAGVTRQFWAPRYLDFVILRSCLVWFYVRVNLVMMLLVTRTNLESDVKSLLMSILHGMSETMAVVEKTLSGERDSNNWDVERDRDKLIKAVAAYRSSFSIYSFLQWDDKFLPPKTEVGMVDFRNFSEEEVMAKYVLFPLDDRNCPGGPAFLPEFEECAAEILGTRERVEESDWRKATDLCLTRHKTPKVTESLLRLVIYLNSTKDKLDIMELFARYPRDNSRAMHFRALGGCMKSSRICQAVLTNASDIGDKLRIFERKPKKKKDADDDFHLLEEEGEEEHTAPIPEDKRTPQNNKKKERIRALMMRKPEEIRETILAVAVSKVLRKESFTASVESLLRKRLESDPELRAIVGKLIRDFLMSGPRDDVFRYYSSRTQEMRLSMKGIFAVIQYHIGVWIEENISSHESKDDNSNVEFLKEFAKDAVKYGESVRTKILAGENYNNEELNTENTEIRRLRRKMPLECRLRMLLDKKRNEAFMFYCVFHARLPAIEDLDFLVSDAEMKTDYGVNWKQRMKYLSSLHPFVAGDKTALMLLESEWKMSSAGRRCLEKIIRRDAASRDGGAAISSAEIRPITDSKLDRTLLYYLLYYTLRFGGCVEIYPLPFGDGIYNTLSNEMSTNVCYGIGICACCTADPTAIEKYSHDAGARPHPKFTGGQTPGTFVCVKKHTSSKLHSRDRNFAEYLGSPQVTHPGKCIHKYLHYSKKTDIRTIVVSEFYKTKAEFEACGRLVFGDETFRASEGITWPDSDLHRFVDVISQKQRDRLAFERGDECVEKKETKVTERSVVTTRDAAVKQFHKTMMALPDLKNHISKMCRWAYESVHANDREVTIFNTVPFIVQVKSFKSQRQVISVFRFCPRCHCTKLVSTCHDGTPEGYMCASCAKKLDGNGEKQKGKKKKTTN